MFEGIALSLLVRADQPGSADCSPLKGPSLSEGLHDTRKLRRSQDKQSQKLPGLKIQNLFLNDFRNTGNIVFLSLPLHMVNHSSISTAVFTIF